MRWEDERYVRFYTRNTPEWLALSWRARAVFGLMLREVDRAGILKVGRLGLKGVAVSIQAPWSEVEEPLRELIDDGCVRVSDNGETVILPNYLEAQEVPSSDALRAKEYRARRRTEARDSAVTKRDATVTPRHAPSRDVTERHSVPIRAVPSVPVKETTSPSATRDAKPKREKVPDQVKIDTDAVCEFYRLRWVDQWKPDDRKLPIVPTADWMQLRSVVRSFGVLEAQRLTKLFVDDPDPWLVKQGHALRHLPGRVNGYRATAKPRGANAPLEPCEADTESHTGPLP